MAKAVVEDPVLRPRTKCIKLTAMGKRCKRWSTRGSKLCRGHKEEAQTGVHPNNTRSRPPEAPDHSSRSTTRGGLTTHAQKAHFSATQYVINQQSKAALEKLGVETAEITDPKRVLLDSVNSAWRQRQVWEGMLAAIPQDDWAHVGEPPEPGLPYTAKGARIEVIQKLLGEATKTAARVSKLALDAGIEERIVRLAEEQAALIADTVRAGIIAAIGSLNLSKEAEASAIEAALGRASQKLMELAAGGEQIVEAVSSTRKVPVEVRQ